MTPSYADLYDRLVNATGSTPGVKLAEDLEAHYALHPATFAAKVADVLAAHAAGRISDPWAFLRSDMERVTAVTPAEQAVKARYDRANAERAKSVPVETEPFVLSATAPTWLREAAERFGIATEDPEP